MLDLIRASALPAPQMMSAARGALRVAAEEMVEILVYLAENNRIYGEQARLTLAGWEETSAKAMAARPETPRAVLDYWLTAKNLRSAVFSSLLENPSVSATKLSELATQLKGEWIDLMLESPRVRGSRQLLEELRSNSQLSGTQTVRIEQLLGVTSPPATTEAESRPGEGDQRPAQEFAPASETRIGQASSQGASEVADPQSDEACAAFLSEHAGEIAAEPEKAFQPIGAIQEEVAREPETQAMAAVAAPAGTGSSPASPFPARKKLTNPQDEQRGSVLQKIAQLDVKGRIQLAIKGTKEERSILVRDGTKVVAIAVLDSPKLTDGEVETFAGQKNVLEAVLRTIPLKRRFVKNYAVIRNLVFNPRTPLDISLGLIKNLLVQDLRNLSGNKEVADTVRKLALRMFKQKSETQQKKD
jgi:hypothetical protein